MSKRKKVLLVSTGLMLCVLIVGAVTAYSVYGVGQNDKKYLVHEYEKLPTPPYTQFKSKMWDDAHDFDPSLASVWNYGYTIQPGVSPATVNKAFQQMLKNNGYKITGTYTNNHYKPAIYEFQANNGKISVWGGVGAGRDSNDQLTSGNGVGVTIMRYHD